jgi:single-strand DNA-binding protein
MANDLNVCTFIGRAGQDCELKYLASGTAVAKFSLAVGYKYKDTEETTWLNVTVFGGLGEKVAARYVKKGLRICITGRLSVRQYNDRDGNSRQSVDLIADSMYMLDYAESSGPRQQQNEPTFDPENDIPF